MNNFGIDLYILKCMLTNTQSTTTKPSQVSVQVHFTPKTSLSWIISKSVKSVLATMPPSGEVPALQISLMSSTSLASRTSIQGEKQRNKKKKVHCLEASIISHNISLKGWFTTNVPILYEFLSSAQHRRKYYEECW